MPGYVLIVDDEEDVRLIFSKMLSALNLTTVTANDGKEALAQIKTNMPDMILTDLMMPKMNGFELLAHLQSSPLTRKIPVVIISAISAGEGSSLHRFPGVTKVIQKGNFSIDEFQAIVRTTLSLPIASR